MKQRRVVSAFIQPVFPAARENRQSRDFYKLATALLSSAYSICIQRKVLTFRRQNPTPSAAISLDGQAFRCRQIHVHAHIYIPMHTRTRYLITLGAHAQEGYGTCLCVCVCLSVCTTLASTSFVSTFQVRYVRLSFRLYSIFNS